MSNYRCSDPSEAALFRAQSAHIRLQLAAARIGAPRNCAVEGVDGDLPSSCSGAGIEGRNARSGGLAGWSECEFINAFYDDEIHPSKLGQRLIVDAMLQHTVFAAQTVRAVAPCAGRSHLTGDLRHLPVVAPKADVAHTDRQCVEAWDLSVRNASSGSPCWRYMSSKR